MQLKPGKVVTIKGANQKGTIIKVYQDEVLLQIFEHGQIKRIRVAKEEIEPAR